MKPIEMREVVIEKITQRMENDESIIFISADIGARKLDYLREHFADRFINIGIAEQNLINVSAGLALEGYNVYAYGISSFITTRCYEQIRVNLSILSQVRKMNVNLIGVGCGYSYAMSGPTHQALEDISIIHALPNMEIISPSDWVCSQSLVDYSLNVKGPKYIRLDSVPLKQIYQRVSDIHIEKGFNELLKGDNVCIISTGYMTHKAILVAEKLSKENISVGLIDIFLLRGFDEKSLEKALMPYSNLVTIEEGFVNKGGLDSIMNSFIREFNMSIKLENFGINDNYSFHIGSRDSMHKINNMSVENIIKRIKLY
jgi:transketolase